MPKEPLLSPKQTAFVYAIIAGKTYAQAYKLAGWRVKSDGVANVSAQRLMQNISVRNAIENAKRELAKRAELTVLDLVERLEECRAIALGATPPQASAAVAAVMGTAKLLGLVIDRSESVIQHKPAPLPTQLVELSETEWQRQFDPGALIEVDKPVNDFFD